MNKWERRVSVLLLLESCLKHFLVLHLPIFIKFLNDIFWLFFYFSFSLFLSLYVFLSISHFLPLSIFWFLPTSFPLSTLISLGFTESYSFYEFSNLILSRPFQCPYFFVYFKQHFFRNTLLIFYQSTMHSYYILEDVHSFTYMYRWIDPFVCIYKCIYNHPALLSNSHNLLISSF